MGWKWQGEPGHGYSRLYMAVTPRFVRRQGYGWGGWLKSRPSAARSYAVILRHYLLNLRSDYRAWKAGLCNDFLYVGNINWRCGRKRYHRGLHRFNNYTWSWGERPEYAPIQVSYFGQVAEDGHRLEHTAPFPDYRKPVRNLRQYIYWRRLMRSGALGSRKA